MLLCNKMKDQYPYESAQIKRMIPTRHYGIQDWFGGNLHPYAAELKNGLVLLLDKNLKTLSVGLNEEKLNTVDMAILKEFAKTNKIEFDWRKTTKEELIQLMNPVKT